jgi:CBS domain containing-hemolysin-like protein
MLGVRATNPAGDMSSDDPLVSLLLLLAVFGLVFANGFFVAAEFSMVAVRRSRVDELVEAGEPHSRALRGALTRLDAYLAATQLGITISSLALGWIGEPALAHHIEPVLALTGLPGTSFGAHAIAVTIAFLIITALHIVLGELAPKSLALQKSEATALAVVRPLGFLLWLFRPAIFVLNGLGNQFLRLFGLRPGGEREALHSPDELKLLVAASQRGGLLERAQRQVVERVFAIGERRIGDVMTPRLEIEWVDENDGRDEILRTVRECKHEHLLVGRGSVDEFVGVVRKQDMLDQALDGKDIDPLALVKQIPVVHEGATILDVLDMAKRQPVRIAIIVDEYGGLEGIITQSDLLEAIAGDIPASDDEEPHVLERPDGSLVMDGLMPAADAFERLRIRSRPEDGDFHTLAGFALSRLGRIPEAGDSFEWEGWRFEVAEMDARRIARLTAKPLDDHPAGD